ncbi:hypothetical protein COS83_01245 [archaeon CG07_land_8_20_14_0_80_38_8]|nr:MAG: hypothetical protein COS83_01245 [archaeon CG07_land_8_20_14_0_80_38_8]
MLVIPVKANHVNLESTVMGTNEYMKNLEDKKKISLRKYDELKSIKKQEKYAINLMKNREYFSASKVYENIFLEQGFLTNEQVARMRVLGDRFVDKLINEGMQNLVPIYTTTIYCWGRLSHQSIRERVARKFESKGIYDYAPNDLCIFLA